MPDDTSITLESKEDWVLIRDWYKENPGVIIKVLKKGCKKNLFYNNKTTFFTY